MTQQTSAIGRAAIMSREGVELRAYRDSVGVWTIGAGHTSAAGEPHVTPGLAITVAECDAILSRDLATFEAAVHKAVDGQVLEDHQFDALVSFAFNVGAGAVRGSTAARRVCTGKLADVPEALLFWDKPPEITSRREAEAVQFATPYHRSLPKGRSSDLKPIKAPASTVPAAPSPSQPDAPPLPPAVKPAPLSAWARFWASLMKGMSA